MPKIIQPSFAKGVISPSLYGRVDTAAYQVALAKATNAVIHTYGGVSNRTGTTFIGPVKDHDQAPRFIPFQFKVQDSYVLEFGHQYMRVIRNDAYVTATAVTITGATAADPVVITAASHGYSNGDEVEITGVGGMGQLNGRRFLVANVTTNTFELQDQVTGTDVDGSSFDSYTSGGAVAKIYEIATPYDINDIMEIKYVQSADVMTLTHKDYLARDLSRLDHDNWTLTIAQFLPAQSFLGGLQVTVNTTGSREYVYTVTAVNSDRQESLAGINNTAVNISGITKANPAVVTANSHGFRVGDEVYIASVTGMGEVNGGRFVVGTTTANTFELNGIDSTNYGTYVSGGVVRQTFVRITNGGTTPDNTVTWAAVTGAVRYNVYRKALDGVWGFIGEATSTSFTDVNITADSASSFPIYSDPLSLPNEYPGTSSYFEQRQMFAGSVNRPDTIFYCRTGDRLNLSAASPSGASDAFSATLAARQVNEIRHLIPLNDLIVLTNNSEWRVNSGPDTAFELASIRQKPQSFWGASHLTPWVVGGTVFFVENPKNRVRTIGYSFQLDGYTGTDISLLASHYLERHTIVDWAVQYSPETRFYMCRSDGTALTCTFDQEQEVIAWTDWNTDGSFERVIGLRSATGDLEDDVYFVVKRTINGNTVRYVEKLAKVFNKDIVPENAFYVDSGLTLDSPVAITNITSANPPVVTAPAHGFSNGDEIDISDVLWVPNVDKSFTSTQPIQALGRYKVANVTTNSFTLQTISGADIDGSTWNSYSSGGSVRKAFDTVIGLDHLEGETLVANADGNVVRNLTVSGGKVELPRKFSRLHIGLPYITDIETLDIEPPRNTIQGNLKKISKVTVKFQRSRGMLIGPNVDQLTEMKQREFERYGEPTRLLTGNKRITLKPDWNSFGRLTIRQKDPMPLNILAIIPDFEVSDV